jgi:hypothetical protein
MIEGYEISGRTTHQSTPRFAEFQEINSLITQSNYNQTTITSNLVNGHQSHAAKNGMINQYHQDDEKAKCR